MSEGKLVDERVGNNRFIARKRTRGSGTENYETPTWAVTSLLNRYPEIDGSVMDPCCGPGVIVREVRRLRPAASVVGVELRNIVVPEGCVNGVDALSHMGHMAASGQQVDWVVQNPPFSGTANAQQFALTSWPICRVGMCVFQRTNWLEGVSRGRNLWDVLPLSKVWIFRHRVDCYPEGQVDEKTSGMLCFAWYVFLKEYAGEHCLDWIDDKPDMTYDTRLRMPSADLTSPCGSATIQVPTETRDGEETDRGGEEPNSGEDAG